MLKQEIRKYYEESRELTYEIAEVLESDEEKRDEIIDTTMDVFVGGEYDDLQEICKRLDQTNQVKAKALRTQLDQMFSSNGKKKVSKLHAALKKWSRSKEEASDRTLYLVLRNNWLEDE